MFTKLGMIAAVAALTLATTHANAAQDVVYKGDQNAKKVCMSIVSDDAKALKSSLKRAAYFSPIPYRTIHNYYSCNDLALIDFAHEMDAQNSVAYLHTRGAVGTRVTMEEVASR